MKNFFSLVPSINAYDYLTGFADMAGLLTDRYAGYRYAISLARRLDDEIVNALKEGPTREYLNHYNEVNHELAETTAKISLHLKENGHENLAIEPTVKDSALPDDYSRTLRMPFSHKMAATRAGLGWIGKTDLLVTDEFGPRVRLASILLNERLYEPGIPIDESMCGKCSACVRKCPAQAATGESWNIRTDRDAFYDPFKCRKKCRELSLTALNEKISLCGMCMSVCPKGANR